MSISAIICEYNPFHNGHKYHIEKHRRELDSDGVICIMSGSFTQRGLPACADKWSRAQMAVAGGADLVLELPVIFCTQTAERFAYGAVATLDALGIADHLSFGSECGDIRLLEEVAELLLTPGFQEEIKKEYSGGVSYPAARAAAAARCFGGRAAEVLAFPNNILALSYIMAARRLDSKILMHTIPRSGAEHDSAVSSENIASASKIRAMLGAGEDISRYVPEYTTEILKKAALSGKTPRDLSTLGSVLAYLLRTQTPEQLSDICDMTEGLENRFIAAGRQCASLDGISELVKTKRYTKSRVDRVMLNIILNITKENADFAPYYIRVLALNERGAELLKELKRRSALPVITKAADAALSGQAARAFKKDTQATDIYSLLTDNPQAGQDFKTSPVFLKK